MSDPYERNGPLPSGDFRSLFHDTIEAMIAHAGPAKNQRITPENVVQFAWMENQPRMASTARRLLLPGSGLTGTENLIELVDRARAGESGLICSRHVSNLDVPTLCALSEDAGLIETFNRIIWVAGRKLNEDSLDSRVCTEVINRIVLTPRGWFNESNRSAEEISEAKRVNIAAQRSMLRLRREGWVFCLFPTGTRERSGRPETREAIGETDSYIRLFDNLVFCDIEGSTMPASNNEGLIHETPVRDRVVYRFGPVIRAQDWREAAIAARPDEEPRDAVRQAVMEGIFALSGT